MTPPIITGEDISGESLAQDYTEFVTNTIYTEGTSILITRAKVIFPTNKIPNGSIVFLSADGGSNWEEASWNEWYTFNNRGYDLRLKIRSVVGSEILVDNSYGKSIPLKVQYEKRT